MNTVLFACIHNAVDLKWPLHCSTTMRTLQELEPFPRGRSRETACILKSNWP